MGERALTVGEIALAQRVFKNSIDYKTVKIHDEKYLFFQPDNRGMTPNGEIYTVGAQTYFADYSIEGVYECAFFIHEMAHVWQYQLNILSPVGAVIYERVLNPFDYAKAYAYELVAGKDLLRYRIEQQAQIIEDFYRRWMEGAPASKHLKNSGGPTVYMPLFQQVLAHFLNNPEYARHVTVCNRDTYGPPGARGITCTRQLVTP